MLPRIPGNCGHVLCLSRWPLPFKICPFFPCGSTRSPNHNVLLLSLTAHSYKDMTQTAGVGGAGPWCWYVGTECDGSSFYGGQDAGRRRICGCWKPSCLPSLTSHLQQERMRLTHKGKQNREREPEKELDDTGVLDKPELTSWLWEPRHFQTMLVQIRFLSLAIKKVLTNDWLPAIRGTQTLVHTCR